MITDNQREYNKNYYFTHRQKLIQSSIEYQKNPINAEKRRVRIRKRYSENHLGFRDKNLKSHDKCKQNPEWVKKKRVIISIWGIQNRTPEINKKRWDEYYMKNKEKYKTKRRTDKSKDVNQALRRIEHSRDISIKEQLKDIKIIQNEIINLKQK